MRKNSVRWAPRVSPVKIRRLYENDAQGIVDTDLIDDVAYSFYARCQSILTVTEASHGRVKCPLCDKIITRRGGKEELLQCPDCTWEIIWGDYFKTYRRKQLHGGGAVDAFQEFVMQLPQARSHTEKMLLIDRIVHECHKILTSDQKLSYTRPVAVNLIDGSMGQTIKLLNELAYGSHSGWGAQERKKDWQEKVLRGVKGREKWIK